MIDFRALRSARFSVALILALLAAPALAQSHSTNQAAPRRFPIGGSAPSGAGLKTPPDLARRIAQWQMVDMPFRSQGLTPRETRMIAKLAEAARSLEVIYWRQADPYALTLQAQLKGSGAARDQQILRYLFLNGGQYDLLDGNRSFLTREAAPAGRALYPQGATRESVESYAAAHPDARAELTGPYTLVRAMGSELVGLPYRSAFRAPLLEAARDLREAAADSDDATFAAFLTARADALTSDDYRASDLLWLNLQSPKIDLILGPCRTSLDHLLGVKTTYGAAILIRDVPESHQLELIEPYLAQIQQSLPLSAEDKPALLGRHAMEVADSPFRTGDFLHGEQTLAVTLPIASRVGTEAATRTVFFRNFAEAQFRSVIQPQARRMIDPSQSSEATAAGYLTSLEMRELGRWLGPAAARVDGKPLPIAEALGPSYEVLDEAKADAAGMYAAQWLLAHNALPPGREHDLDVCYLARLLHAVRRLGSSDAHNRAQLMEFNYLVEQGAILARDGDRSRGTARVVFALDYAKLPAAITALTAQLLEMEAAGDRRRAVQWSARYGSVGSPLRTSLESTRDIPLEIFPKFS
jgi:hypothetical protein